MKARGVLTLIGFCASLNAGIQSLAAGLIMALLFWLVMGFFD